MNKWILSVPAIAAIVAVASTAGAETMEKSGTFGGLTVHYKVVLPPGYDRARPYPTILTFPGGGQEMRIVDGRLEANWRAEAERRGWVVVSPAAPDGRLFFESGDRAFPAFLDMILHDYKVAGGRLHITGASNGGLSAFHIASTYPSYFVSVIGYPGLIPEPPLPAEIDALKSLCIFMHVGERDTSWRTAMKEQEQLFRQRGFKVHFSVEPGQEHLIQTLAGKGSARLFDELEEASRGCSRSY